MKLPKDRILTDAQMNAMASPPIGVVFFNTTRGIFIINNGTDWVENTTSGKLWTVLMSEGFEGGAIPAAMTTVNDTLNEWVVGTAEKYEGTYGLYVSNDSGASADYSSSNVCHLYMDIPLPIALVKWRLRAFWKAVAEANFDYTRVYLDNTAAYVPTAGSLPTGLEQIGGSQYNGQSSWSEDTIEMDGTEAGNTVRVVISFISDGSVENAPSICLDNFNIEYL